MTISRWYVERSASFGSTAEMLLCARTVTPSVSRARETGTSQISSVVLTMSRMLKLLNTQR